MTLVCNQTGMLAFLAGLGHDPNRPETAQLADRLVRILPRLRAGLRAETDKLGVLRVWLTPAAEALAAEAMAESVSLGHATHELAAAVVTEEVARRVPETANFGCAPLPSLNDCQENACRTGGYGTTTWANWRGGCEACALAERCPRKRFAR